MKTIKSTTDRNMCISCGICSAVCPKQCIEFESSGGMNIPKVGAECVNCGKCLAVCPGKGFDYEAAIDKESDDFDFWLGSYMGIYTACAKDAAIRKNAVSGGVVTALVSRLLQDGEYKSAFLVNDNNYTSNLVYTERCEKATDLKNTQKSRYLLVSHEKAVKYILANRDEKIILVGTGCFVQGITNLIREYRLDRSNYFIIGLFCDRTMSMNVIEYFKRYANCGDNMSEFFFRTKEVGGWPGGVRIKSGDKCLDLPSAERMKVKDYFQPERCLYCLDKLNMFADISVGDNYTGKDSDRHGSNSVAVRTAVGNKIWQRYSDEFEINSSTEASLRKSQHIADRSKNYWFALLKQSGDGQMINNTGDLLTLGDTVPIEAAREYKKRMKKIAVGAKYKTNPTALKRALQMQRLKYILLKFKK